MIRCNTKNIQIDTIIKTIFDNSEIKMKIDIKNLCVYKTVDYTLIIHKLELKYYQKTCHFCDIFNNVIVYNLTVSQYL